MNELLKKIVNDQALERINSDFTLKDYAKSEDIENSKQLPKNRKYFLSIIIYCNCYNFINNITYDKENT